MKQLKLVNSAITHPTLLPRTLRSGAHRWPVNRMPLSRLQLYAMGLIDTVLEYSTTAREKFTDVVAAMKHPDIQRFQKEGKGAFTYDTIRLLRMEHAENVALQELDAQVYDFILTCFNTDDDCKYKTYRVKPDNAPYLCLAVIIRAQMALSGQPIEYFTEYRSPDLERVMSQAPGKYGNPKTAADRKLKDDFTQNSTREGFVIVHHEKIKSACEKWYFSRVVFSNPINFARAHYKETNNTDWIEPSDIRRDIRIIDSLTGYPIK